MKKVGAIETKYSNSYSIYDIFNMEFEDATYIECEGENCIRVDFNNMSIWFDIYKHDRFIRGVAPASQKKVINKIAKQYKFIFGTDFEYSYEMERV